MRSRNLYQVLCFVRTKHGASRLARQLEKDGLITSAIHGDKDQKARLEALEAFKEGKLQVLVATDVAARGLDIDDLPLVVNYELPYVPEDYIHRIGRTGRAGRLGRGDLVRRARRGALPGRDRAAAEEDGADRRSPRASTRSAGSRREHGERGDRGARPAPADARAARAARRSPPARRGASRTPAAQRSADRAAAARGSRASSASAPTHSTPTSRCRRRATTRACPADRRTRSARRLRPRSPGARAADEAAGGAGRARRWLNSGLAPGRTGRAPLEVRNAKGAP